MPERRPVITKAWGRVLLALLVFLGLHWSLSGGTGLVRTIYGPRPALEELAVARVPDLALPEGSDISQASSGPVTIVWRGHWNVPADRPYDLTLDGDGHVTWKIDDTLAHEATGRSDTRTVWLARGFHSIEIASEQPPVAGRLSVTAAAEGQQPRRLEAQEIKPRLPRNPRLRSIALVLRDLSGVAAAFALLIAVRRTIGWALERWPISVAAITRAGQWKQPMTWLLLSFIVGYGALLRLDAIAARFGPVTAPAWLAAVQTRAVLAPETIRPSTFSWNPAGLFPHQGGPPTHYMSDPYTYIKYGREMQTFYEAHYREPVFTFTTKLFLRLLDDQDVAVSFASASWSVFAILGTYLLGAALWSRPVGLIAATAMAVDYDVITLASLGWRDDAYVAAVAFTLWMFVSARRIATPPRRVALGRWRVDIGYATALALGVVAGLAILVRIMAAAFVVPGFMLLALTGPALWRRRLNLVAAATLAAVFVAGPYFYNCWRVYGDPLYSFNVHANVYNMAEGRGASDESTAAYVLRRLQSQPFERAETMLRGVTTYPFSNKWQGLDKWHDSLGTWASLGAVAGLIVLAASADGRLATVLLLAALLPFSFTWRTDASARFTLFAYPLLLVAVGVAISASAWVLHAVLVPGRGMTRTSARGQLRPWLPVMGGAMLVAWVLVRVLPPRVFAEALAKHTDVTIDATTAGAPFLGSGWSVPTGSGNVRTRIVTDTGRLSIYLPRADDYPMTLRLDPFPRPLSAPAQLPVIEVTVNGTSIATLPLQWSADRVGSYRVVLPHAVVRAGHNDIRLSVVRAAESNTRPGLTEGAAFALWYARIHPPTLAPN